MSNKEEDMKNKFRQGVTGARELPAASAIFATVMQPQVEAKPTPAPERKKRFDETYQRHTIYLEHDVQEMFLGEAEKHLQGQTGLINEILKLHFGDTKLVHYGEIRKQKKLAELEAMKEALSS